MTYALSAWAFLIVGSLTSIAGLFGEEGYITATLGDERLTGWETVGGWIGLVGLIYSLVTAWFLYSVMRRRGLELSRTRYLGMVDFFLNQAFPRSVSLWGELTFVTAAYTALSLLTATLLGASVYTPLGQLTQFLLTPLEDELGTGMARMLRNHISISRDNFGEGIGATAALFFAGFAALVFAYLAREVWSYALRVLTAFASFLPRFAIPLRVRYTAEHDGNT